MAPGKTIAWRFSAFMERELERFFVLLSFGWNEGYPTPHQEMQALLRLRNGVALRGTFYLFFT